VHEVHFQQGLDETDAIFIRQGVHLRLYGSPVGLDCVLELDQRCVDEVLIQLIAGDDGH
jgi:hypothetical protein